MRNAETNETLLILQDGSITSTQPQPSSESRDTINKQTLYVKEKFNISDKTYHELSMVHPSLPRWSTSNKISKDMDCNSTIFRTPGAILGIQQSLKNRLTIRLEHMVKINPSLKNESIKLKSRLPVRLTIMPISQPCLQLLKWGLLKMKAESSGTSKYILIRFSVMLSHMV